MFSIRFFLRIAYETAMRVQLFLFQVKIMRLAEAIQARIIELAKKNKMTIYALSKKSGVPQSTISTLTSSKSVGSAIIYGICEGLEITLKEFFDSPLFDRGNLID